MADPQEQDNAYLLTIKFWKSRFKGFNTNLRGNNLHFCKKKGYTRLQFLHVDRYLSLFA